MKRIPALLSLIITSVFFNVGGYAIAADGPYNYQFSVEKLYDFSGNHRSTNSGDESGISVKTIIHSPSGLITGAYDETYTNGIHGIRSIATVTGKVLTVGTGIIMRNKLFLVANGRYVNDGSSLHFEATVKGDYHFADDSLIGSLKGRVCFTRSGGTECTSGSVPDSINMLPDMDGTWQLVLNINGDTRLSGNATATLSNGKTVSFSCAGTKNTAGTIHLRLAGIGDAVGAKLIVTLGSAGEMQKMVGKVFGQKVLVLR